jgi:hypothetical protein
MTDEATKKRRNRPKMPAVERVRTWTWYAAVKKRAAAIKELRSDNKLDKEIIRHPALGEIDDDERLRVFTRIRHFATDPVNVQVKKVKFNLVNCTEAATGDSGTFRGIPGTRAIYDSEFWNVLAEPRMSLSEIRAALALLAARLQIYRADLATAAFAKKNGWQEVPFTPGVTADYKKALRKLSMTGDIDALTFLAVLFLEAKVTNLFEQAIYLRQMLQLALRRFFENNEIPLHLANLIAAIVAACILLNAGDRVARLTIPAGWSPYKFGKDPTREEFYRGIVELKDLVDYDFDGVFPWVPIDETITMYKHTVANANPEKLKRLEREILKSEHEQMWDRGTILHALNSIYDPDDTSIHAKQDYAPLFFGFPWQPVGD